MNLFFYLLMTVVVGTVLAMPASISAQQYNSYIWQSYLPNNITGTSDLQIRLEKEVQKVINAGHLAPFRTIYGETNAHFYWYHRYDTIYTLSLALPYLSSALQTSTKNYLKTELQNYPLWTENLLDPQVGFKRGADSLTNPEIGSIRGDYAKRPKMFAMYALWLYAQNSGDWAYIDTNWSNITAFYTRNKAEVNSQYTAIAGAIGMARMAQQKTSPDQTTKNAVLTDLNVGLNNGKNFLQFAQNSENAYNWPTDDWSNFTKPEVYNGFQFLDITPEIGRYFFDDPTLKTKVIGTQTTFITGGGAGIGGGIVFDTPEEEYALGRAEFFMPFWYIAQAPVWSRYYGEGSGSPPDARSMIFPLKAWVQKENASQLRKYLDVPDALVGDYYYMQNMARAIEASGAECWEDITTTAQECPGPLFATGSPTPSPTPSPSPSASPSPLPSPSTAKPGDIDGNNKVDIFDYNILLTNFGKTGSGIQGDLNGNNKVDIFDYNTLLTNFGK